MNTTCCKMIQDKNEESSNKISAADSSSTTSSTSSTTTIIATTDITTCRNNNNNNNPCSNNAIGSNGCGVAILRANDNDPNYGDSSSNTDGDKNRDILTNRRVVGQIKIKKEEIKDSMQQHDNNNNNNNNLDDNSYADWKVGSWCWLLPTAKTHEDDRTNTTDRKRKQKQRCRSLLDNNNINEDGNDVNYGDPATAAAGNIASIRNDDGIYKDDDNDNKKEPVKKKMRINDEDEEEEENNEHKTDTAATVTTTTTTKNDSSKDKNDRRDNKNDDGYESWTNGNWCWLLPAGRSIEEKRSKSDTNTGQINISSSSNKDDDDDDDDDLVIKQGGKSGNDGPREEDICDDDDDDDDNDGYESWTVGNWCWILPPSSDDAMPEETAEHRRTGVVPTVNETTNSRVCSSPRRHCRSSSSSVRRLLHDDDDDFENNSDNEPINSNTGRITMSYTKRQNKMWHEMYQRLVAYKKQHDDSTNVPRGYEADPKLGIWVMNQRKLYTNNEISEERINYLDSIGFAWKTNSVVPWDEMFQRLVTYRKKFRSTLVPQKRKPTLVPQKYLYLGRWVNTQRACYRKNELSVKRINLLESIGFVWNPRDEQWMEMYQKLVAYKKQHRSTKVPTHYTDDPQLGIWVMHQRQVFNGTSSGILTKKRLEQLNSINFTWSVK